MGREPMVAWPLCQNLHSPRSLWVDASMRYLRPLLDGSELSEVEKKRARFQCENPPLPVCRIISWGARQGPNSTSSSNNRRTDFETLPTVSPAMISRSSSAIQQKPLSWHIRLSLLKITRHLLRCFALA